jgi:hypothetical protein
MNTHASLISRVGAQALKDIEGLDPLKHGFCRQDCCEPLPAKLAGSFEPLSSHLFLSTDTPPPQWTSKADNVTGFPELSAKLKDAAGFKVTAFHRPGPDTANLFFKYDDMLRTVVITEFSCVAPGELPWEAKGAVACDRTDETFIFVCSHRVRDDRCGYCGPVLVDLLRAALLQRLGKDASVYVFPCSHVGGHTYAGNVLVYTKHGGVCFGCFCPTDVDALVGSIESKKGLVPDALVAKVRGTMGPSPGDKGRCSVQ